MKTVTNIDLIISLKSLFLEKLQESNISIAVYDVVFPANDERAGEFYLIKPIFLRDRGNIDMPGTVEICAYVENLKKQNDQSQPNINRLKFLTDLAAEILDDAIKNSIAITSIEINGPINHHEIKSFYNSIVCGTFSVKSIN